MQILKKILFGSFVFCALAANASAQKYSAKPATTHNTTKKNSVNKFSTAFGNLVGDDLAKAGIIADYFILVDFVAAVEAALDKKPMLDMQQAAQITQKIMEPVQMAMQAKRTLPTLSAEDKVQFSKSLGTLLADKVTQIGVKDFNIAKFSDGLAAALSGKPSMEQAEAEAEYKKGITAIRDQKNADINAQKGELEKAGKEFLAKNKDKKGVITTASGLQYEVLEAGTGAKPTSISYVKVHYHGTLIDGTVFDSSVGGEPIAFSLVHAIEGWQEGIPKMQVGAKYRFFIPHQLAYGAKELEQIPLFSTLIFDVELLDVE